MGDQYNLGFYAMVSEIVDQFTDEKRILDDFSERRFLKVKLQACFYFIKGSSLLRVDFSKQKLGTTRMNFMIIGLGTLGEKLFFGHF